MIDRNKFPIHQCFEYQAKTTPNAIALHFEDETRSYEQLNQQANQLAHYLQAKGVGVGDFVSLYLDRSFEMIVAILGVLKSGAVYVPIDPDTPAQRVQFIAIDAQTELLLTQQKLASDIEGVTAQVISLDAEWTSIAQYTKHNPDLDISVDKLAYVIYTSGSTGKPKGVLITHHNVIRLLTETENWYHFNDDDIWTLFHSYAFDVSVWEMWGALFYGGQLVIPSYKISRSPQHFYELLVAKQVTVLCQTPSAFRPLLQVEATHGAHPDLNLRLIIFAGEALALHTLKPWFDAHGDERPQIINMYGITETTVHAMYCRITEADLDSGSIIGEPIPDLQIHILDEQMNPSSQCVPGEIYVGGAGVGRGYHNRPELTAARFIADPFSDDPQARLYRSGDLAQHLPDGNIEFLGRMDHQVKIRGFRVELGEIEATLAEHPDLQEVVVLAREDQSGQQKLVAYIIPAANTIPTVTDLQQFLQPKLPTYMTPSAFVSLEAMPLTTNGKLDRKALPNPDVTRPALNSPYVSARTQLETILVDLWQTTLNLEGIGVKDNFFELGGDSLSGAVVINALQQQLGEYLYIVALFDAPTIVQMADYLETHYASSVARLLGQTVDTEMLQPNRRLEPIHLRGIKQLLQVGIEVETSIVSRSSDKNPPAVFILSPPRSGSTLLRVMLAGHTDLFAPPELDLLNFVTLAQRQQMLANGDSFRLAGTVRALMALHDCGADEAQQMMTQYEQQGMTTVEFFKRLQDQSAAQFVIDKTTFYALDLATLHRIEQQFDQAMYIHLTRHPYGMIHSFEGVRSDRIYFKEQDQFSPREIGELTWLLAHQNILDFLSNVPTNRHHHLSYESLIRQPKATMTKLCHFLGIQFQPDMIDPYHDSHVRMTDGLYGDQASRMLGDVKFHEHRQIDPTVADRWRDSYQIDFLSEQTWQLATELGYDNDLSTATPSTSTPIKIVPRQPDVLIPLSFTQQRLWFLDQYEPDSAAYNIPLVLQLEGAVNVDALEHSLNEIVRRHEMLRTNFVLTDYEPYQMVKDEIKLPLHFLDLSQLDEAERNTKLSTVINEEIRAPFNLARDQLLRAMLLQLDLKKYTLVLVLHHTAGDGWSIGLLFRELAALYQAYTTDTPADLPPLSIQYADYTLWQRVRLEEGLFETQLSYWEEQLKLPLPTIELPTDYPRPALQTFNGNRHTFMLSQMTTDQLTSLGHQTDTTLFMVLLAAFKVLLARCTSQTDIIVGSPIANRGQTELEALIGFFANTLVLRTDLQGNPTFKELLGRVRQTTLEAFEYQETPVEKLIEVLVPDRDLSRNPLFQIMFILQNANMDPVPLSGLTLTPLDYNTGTTKFDLTMMLSPTASGLKGIIEYNTDLFQAKTIERFTAHFLTLIESILANPTQPLSTFKVLTTFEMEQLLQAWNDTQVDYPQDLCVHQLFERQAQRTPDRVAVVDETQQITYEDLNRRANQVGHYLIQKGVTSGDLVGICVDRSIDMMVGLLGILKAGAAYVPLDPSYPHERLGFMLADANVASLLTQASLIEQLPSTDCDVICLDQDWPKIASSNIEPPVNRATSQNLAYVIYTSGSTGKPKGVQLPHQAVVNFLTTMADCPGISSDDTLLAVTTLSFDIAVLELFLPLTVGAKVVLASREMATDGEQLSQQLNEANITLMQATPTTWRLLLEAGWPGSPQLKALCGGEALPRSLANEVLEKVDVLWNMYGPTETTIWSLVHPVTVGDGFVPIGKPIGNTQVYVLDQDLQPVPIGVSGELYIGGDGVAQGYLDRDALTAERFITDPFASDTTARLYKTGDLVRYQLDDEEQPLLEFLGRQDHQVKVRGFRIELGEIELALQQFPAIQQSIVVVRFDQADEMKSLVAYLITDTNVDIVKLRQFLGERLPDYMIPVAFVSLSQWPLTPNGKIDRKALPAPDMTSLAMVDFVAPEGPVEEMLAEIWGDVFGLDQIGLHDNFFHLGGHSLLAVRVISRLRQEYDINIPLRSLFESPTIAELTVEIEKILLEE